LSQLIVLSNARPVALARADGTGLLNGNGRATSESEVNAALAVGFELADGANLITNGVDAEILITNSVRASATSIARASGLDIFDASSATKTTDAQSNGAVSYGISAGDGANQILNAGSMTVTSAPRATSNTTSTFNNSGLALAVDSYATASSSADNAKAFGISAGDGSNVIHNTGSLIVSSAPIASATSVARGYRWEGDAFAEAFSSARNAVAMGISGGDGGNLVTNSGVIDVGANPIASSSASAIPGEITITLGGGSATVCWFVPVLSFP
jgi:hypothetical protein